MIESLFEKIAFDCEIIQTEERLLEGDLPVLPIAADANPAPESPFAGYLNRCRMRDAERNRRQHLQAQRSPWQLQNSIPLTPSMSPAGSEKR